MHVFKIRRNNNLIIRRENYNVVYRRNCGYDETVAAVGGGAGSGMAAVEFGLTFL